MIIIIPARGNSKGIPQKNIKLLNGIPLLGYSIDSARKCKYIDRVYVSTDDITTRNISIKYGAEVIDRPSQFATDTSTDLDVLRHAVTYLDCYEDIVYLRPTSPIRKQAVLEEAIQLFLKNPDCTSLRSAHECSETAYKYFKLENNYWAGLFNNELEGAYYDLPRQQLPKTFHGNGYIDIVKPTHFMKDGMTCYGDKILAFITEYIPEIDTIQDFKYTEFLLYDKN